MWESIEKRIDGAIEKTDNLSRTVQIDKMKEQFDEIMEQSRKEQAMAYVAEQEFKYGADMYDAYVEKMGEVVDDVREIQSKTQLLEFEKEETFERKCTNR